MRLPGSSTVRALETETTSSANVNMAYAAVLTRLPSNQATHQGQSQKTIHER